MTITSAIVLTDPDGSIITVSELDDAIVQHKIDVRERMETLIDTAAADWTDTTGKELIEGLARLFTATSAPSAPTDHTLQDGQVWIDTDAAVSGPGVQYRESGAWVDLPVTTQMILTNAITTTKIANGTISLGKLTANAFWDLRVDISDTGADTSTSSTFATVDGGTPCSDSFTPISTGSLIVCFGFALTDHSGNTAHHTQLRIRRTSGTPATIAESRGLKQLIATAGEYQPLTLIGVELAPSVASHTYALEFADSGNGASGSTAATVGGTIPSRLMVFELKTS